MKKFLVTLSLLFVGGACLVLGACNSNKVQISFDTDGGTAISSKKIDKGAEYELPVPEKSGYEFEGWYDSQNLTGEAVTTVKVTGNATYYAKWAELFSVNLDANGGTVSQTSLKLKDGANLYDFLQSYVPVKTDYKFDCWMNGDTPVTPNYRMTESVELTARYMVKYSVEIYKESLDGSTYEKDDEVLTGYGYVGATVIPEVSADAIVGFAAVGNDGEVVSLTLSATAADNLYKLYYDRETYTVTFRGNYPDGYNPILATEQVRYGESVNLPADFECTGYCLEGWATSASGEAEYEVDCIAEKIYGGDEVTPATFKPSNDIGLYAVWKKGCTDMFGGGDVVFLFDETPDKIYLYRGGVFFEGEYDGESGEFSVINGTDTADGRIYPDGTFSYFNAYTYMASLPIYRYGTGVDDTAAITLDGFNGITYSEKGAEGVTSSKGTYIINDEGLYVVEFTEGALEGETMTMLLATITVQNSSENVFLVRDEEKYGSGVIYLATYRSDDGSLSYMENSDAMIFTGFGNAYLYDGSTYTSVICSVDGDTLTYSSSDGSIVQAKLLKVYGRNCYLPYDAATDIVATNKGDSLTLDGYGNAVWNKNGAKTFGTYVAGTTPVGQLAVTLYSNSKAVATFTVDGREVGDDTPAKIKYSYTQKPLGYEQYIYADATGVYEGVYVVLNDEFTDDGNSAAVYAKIDNKLVKISSGTYEDSNGLIVYSVDTFDLPDGADSPFGDDVPDEVVLTAVWAPVSPGVTLPALTCLEYTVEDVSVTTAVDYISADGGMLTLVSVGSLADAAIYVDKSGNMTLGAYLEDDDLVVMTDGSDYFYFSLDKDDMTFETLLFAPYGIYKLNEKLDVDDGVSIYFTGKGKTELLEAIYIVTDGQDETTVDGTVKENDDGTYSFVSNDENTQFEFKLFTAGSDMLFGVYNEAYSGRYVSGYGTLELDGYGYMAELTNADGTFSGVYSIVEENVVLIADNQNGKYFYADIISSGASHSFTLRGEEFGTFYLYDNAYMSGVMMDFDGYGNLKVYTSSGEEEYIDENGTYEVDGDVITIHYDGKSATGVFRVMNLEDASLPLFITVQDEVIGSYVDASDLSVVVLDGAGNAVKFYGSDGVREDGYYLVITDNLFYYYNETGESACVYEYDAATRAVTAKNYSVRAYYTDAFEPLLFTKYGYAVCNGESLYYYVIESDNSITLYRRPEEGETGANAYNFVKVENFCRYNAASVELEGRTYKLNNGLSVSFGRNADDAAKYPVAVPTGAGTASYSLGTLSFTPEGSADFVVSGTVMMGGVKYNCYVVRETAEDELETYLMVPLTSLTDYYRVDIELDFGGASTSSAVNSFYTVKSVTHVSELDSYVYLYNYLMHDYFATIMGHQYGVSVENIFGTIIINTEYDQAGAESGIYLDFGFGSFAAAYDAEGELISAEHIACEYDEEARLYECEFTYSDGYTYRLRFAVQPVKENVNGYILHSLVRVQTLTDGDYTVEVETLLASDYFNAVGEVFEISLKKGEEDIDLTTCITLEYGVYYISRKTEEGSGKITSTDCYEIALAKTAYDASVNGYPVYVAVWVDKLGSVETVYGENGKTYADVDTANDKVLYFYLYDGDKNTGASYIPYICDYSEEDGEYTVTLYSGRVFTVKVTEQDAVVITEVELPE